jgi:hypothetical protein
MKIIDKKVRTKRHEIYRAEQGRAGHWSTGRLGVGQEIENEEQRCIDAGIELFNVLAASGVGGVSLQEGLAVEGLEAFRAANTSRPRTGPPLGGLARGLVPVTVAHHGLFALPLRPSTAGANKPQVQVRHVDVHREIDHMSRMSCLALLTVPSATGSGVALTLSPSAILELAII